MVETIRQHADVDYAQARQQAIDLLIQTGLENAESRMQEYPHQFSGSMRQLVVIALALCTNPEVIIADEPTSALDVSIQAQILNLLKDLQQKLGFSILFISHNLAVIRQMSDRVVVLKNGVIIEDAEAETFFAHPKAEYSQQLLADTPSLDFVTHS